MSISFVWGLNLLTLVCSVSFGDLECSDFCYCTLKRVDFFSRNFENHNYSQINQSDLWNSVTQLGERKTCKYLVQRKFLDFPVKFIVSSF